MSNISIFVTTYNSEATIGEVISSLRAQTDRLKDIASVIIADDGSKDRTLEIIQDGWKDCPVPLKIIRRDRNIGEWNNVNDALSSLPPETDWILKLHSDNPLKPHWSEVMLAAIKSCPENVATICSSYDSRFPGGHLLPGEDDAHKPPVLVPGDKTAIRSTALKGCWWNNCGCALRIKAFKQIGGFSGRFKQKGDWEWLLRALHLGWGVLYLPRTLFIYAQVEGNLSSVNLRNDVDLREGASIFRKYLSYVEPIDIVAYHFQNISFALRRMARALSRMDLSRMGKVLQTILFLVGSCFACLSEKSSGAAAS